jgi:hypothetical protein
MRRRAKDKAVVIVSVFCLAVLMFSSALAVQGGGTVDLAANVDITLVGMGVSDGVSGSGPGQIGGLLMTAAADVNNDGMSDLLVGVPFNDGPDGKRTNAGAAYVILAQKGQSLPLVRDLNVAKPDVILYGAEANDQLGISLATGDLNGDGIADIIVGAPQSDGPNNTRPNVGKVFILFGGASLTMSPVRDTRALSPVGPAPDLTIIGWGGPPDAGGTLPGGDAVGSSVGSGDVNGDGIDDLIVGAPGVKGPDGKRTANGNGGAAYVLYGSKSLAAGTKDLGAGNGTIPAGVDIVVYGKTAPLVIGGIAIPGTRVGESLGAGVAVGDVNGDKMKDLIVGASTFTNPDTFQGIAYVFFGSKTPTSPRDTMVANAPKGPDASILGINTLDFLGRVMAIADVNGDGIDDMTFGASSAPGPGDRPNAGSVYVVFGSAALKGRRDLGNANQKPDVLIYGAETGDGFGSSVAAADMNGDGVKDIVIGAPVADGPNNQRDGAGEVYIVHGGASLKSGTTRDVSTQAGQGVDGAISGANTGDEVGFSIAVGDFNGDGKADIAATAPFGDGPSGAQRPKAGVVYVVLGK